MRAFLLSLSVKYQMLFVVGVTVCSAFLIASICSMFFDEHQLVANTDLISSIYQVMGTIYAILLTFTLWGIWQNYTAADLSVQQEGYALVDLVHTLNASPIWQKLNIRNDALTYLSLVIEQEWPFLKNMTNSFINFHEDTHSAALTILQTVQNIAPTSERETAIFSHALTLLSNWLDARRTRLLSARGNSAKALWPLLFTGSIVLFCFHGLFIANTIGIWVMLLLGISLVIGLTFYLIFTLDTPFSGSPSIDPEPFVLAVNILKNSIA